MRLRVGLPIIMAKNNSPIYIRDIIKDRSILEKLKLSSPDEESQKREDYYFAQLSELIEQYPIISGRRIRRG